MSTVTSSRINQMSPVLEELGIDAFFATTAVTMGYLSGLHEEGGERLLMLALSKTGKARLIAPALARTQAERSGIADIRTWNDGEDPMKLIQELASDWNLESSRIAVDDEMRSSILLDLQRTLRRTEFVAGQPVLSELTRKKDAYELGCLRKAGSMADGALAPVLSEIRVGTTEWEINESLQRNMRKLGGEPAFCIVATGANGAEPHHMTDQTPLKLGDVVVMDYGCSFEGYKSDITRVVALGESTEEQRKVYEIVYRAFMAGRNAIAPGVLAEDVDKATRKVIEDEGYGEFFVHRTGHGLGMRIHEEPYICAGNKHKLEVGNVFSIEPGIYLPGKFGVRIENIVAVTENGHESMNAEPSPTLLVVPV